MGNVGRAGFFQRNWGVYRRDTHPTRERLVSRYYFGVFARRAAARMNANMNQRLFWGAAQYEARRDV